MLAIARQLHAKCLVALEPPADAPGYGTVFAWLNQAYGTLGLPETLSSPLAATLVEGGDDATLLQLLNFLKAQLDASPVSKPVVQQKPQPAPRVKPRPASAAAAAPELAPAPAPARRPRVPTQAKRPHHAAPSASAVKLQLQQAPSSVAITPTPAAAQQPERRPQQPKHAKESRAQQRARAKSERKKQSQACPCAGPLHPQPWDGSTLCDPPPDPRSVVYASALETAGGAYLLGHMTDPRALALPQPEAVDTAGTAAPRARASVAKPSAKPEQRRADAPVTRYTQRMHARRGAEPAASASAPSQDQPVASASGSSQSHLDAAAACKVPLADRAKFLRATQLPASASAAESFARPLQPDELDELAPALLRNGILLCELAPLAVKAQAGSACITVPVQPWAWLGHSAVSQLSGAGSGWRQAQEAAPATLRRPTRALAGVRTDASSSRSTARKNVRLAARVLRAAGGPCAELGNSLLDQADQFQPGMDLDVARTILHSCLSLCGSKARSGSRSRRHQPDCQPAAAAFAAPSASERAASTQPARTRPPPADSAAARASSLPSPPGLPSSSATQQPAADLSTARGKSAHSSQPQAAPALPPIHTPLGRASMPASSSDSLALGHMPPATDLQAAATWALAMLKAGGSLWCEAAPDVHKLCDLGQVAATQHVQGGRIAGNPRVLAACSSGTLLVGVARGAARLARWLTPLDTTRSVHRKPVGVPAARSNVAHALHLLSAILRAAATRSAHAGSAWPQRAAATVPAALLSGEAGEAMLQGRVAVLWQLLHALSAALPLTPSLQATCMRMHNSASELILEWSRSALPVLAAATSPQALAAKLADPGTVQALAEKAVPGIVWPSQAITHPATSRAAKAKTMRLVLEALAIALPAHAEQLREADLAHGLVSELPAAAMSLARALFSHAQGQTPEAALATAQDQARAAAARDAALARQADAEAAAMAKVAAAQAALAEVYSQSQNVPPPSAPGQFQLDVSTAQSSDRALPLSESSQDAHSTSPAQGTVMLAAQPAVEQAEPSTAEVAAAPAGLLQTAAEVVHAWLQSAGVTLQQPWTLESPVAPEFSDGLILCFLVEKLLGASLGKAGLKGVDRAPRSPAAKLNNIRRALTALSDEPSMPLDYLASEHAIRDGATAIIIPLLLQMRALAKRAGR